MAVQVTPTKKPFVSPFGGMAETGMLLLPAADVTLSEAQFRGILETNATLVIEDTRTAANESCKIIIPTDAQILAAMKALTPDGPAVAINATSSSIKAGAVKFIPIQILPPSTAINWDNDGYGFRLMPDQVFASGDISRWRNDKNNPKPYNVRTSNRNLMTPLARLAGIDFNQANISGQYQSTRVLVRTSGDGADIGSPIYAGETAVLMVTCTGATTVDVRLLKSAKA